MRDIEAFPQEAPEESYFVSIASFTRRNVHLKDLGVITLRKAEF